ncbi:MAG TPA: PHP domain-containing protein [Candidatus Lokiarchaeia archaeon]|nr:PHP domain-containing protein [Candidatus Lokiarchaeia archaeon]
MPDPRIQDYHLHSIYSDGDNTIPSIAHACDVAGCHEIAITDHVDQDGNLTFVADFRRDHTLQDYFKFIHDFKEESIAEYGVRMHVGIELSTTTSKYRDAIEKNIVPIADDIELVLIEGYDTSGPVSVAMAVRENLDDAGHEDLPIVIAHPDFAELIGDIEILVNNNIGLELNEAKFSPAHRQTLERILQEIDDQSLAMPRFTIGSDAHQANYAGRVDIVHAFAREHGLLENLTWL